MSHEKYPSSSKERCIKTGALLGAVSLGGLIAADHLVSRHQNRHKNDKAEVISNIRPGEHSVLVIPGYHADGRVLAKNFDRHIEHLGSAHYVVHPDKGMNIDSYKEEILKARKADGHRPLIIYSLSMGALLDAKIASDEAVRSEMGEVHRKVIDSGLSGKGDLSLSSRIGILAGSTLPLTLSTDKLYHTINQHGTGEDDVDYDPELVTHEEAIARIRSTRQVRFAAAKGQIPFMHREDVARLDLAQAGSEIQEGIIYLSSLDDHLIDTVRSAHQYSGAYDVPVEFRYDLSRKERSHATGPENPRGVVDALEGKNRDKYMAKDIRVMIDKYHQTQKTQSRWRKKVA